MEGFYIIGTPEEVRVKTRLEYLREQADVPEQKNGKPICPTCDKEIWDVAKGSKLNKCWGCGTAFDSME